MHDVEESTVMADASTIETWHKSRDATQERIDKSGDFGNAN